MSRKTDRRYIRRGYGSPEQRTAPEDRCAAKEYDTGEAKCFGSGYKIDFPLLQGQDEEIEFSALSDFQEI